MSEVSERNMANFYLGDNVYELADGVIPEIAERLDMKLGEEPNKADLQDIMDKVGRNKRLRENEEITAIDRETMVGMIDRAGTQQALSRSLWTPDITVSAFSADAILLVTCAANWQDRAAQRAIALAPDGLRHKPLYSLAGQRVMDMGTERSNPNVQRLHASFERYPKEAEYAGSVIVPKLVDAGFAVLPESYKIGEGDELLKLFFEDNPTLLKKRIAILRNANAGVISAVQMRNAARKIMPDFDANPENPQVLIGTDGMDIARTDKEEADSRNFQKAGTGLRQVVLTAMKLHEAADGE